MIRHDRASGGAPPSILIDARKLADFGIGTYLRGLLEGLARLDLESRYLLLAPKSAPEELPDLPENFHWIEESSPGYSVREQWALWQQIRRLRPDLFHSPHYVLPWRTPTRVVVTIHDLIHLLFPEFLPNRLALLYARGLLRRAVRRADRILTVSAATAADLSRYLQAPAERIEVIWNGVDESFRTPLDEASVESSLRAMGLVRGYYLFLGNPKPHKNLHRVLEAYARLSEARPRLVLAGVEPDSDSAREVRGWAAELGIEARIQMLGRLPPERLPAVVRGALALVFPSLYEGFGLPLAEAMAAGTPVVASSTPALVEVADGAAESCDPLDAASIAAGMERLATDPARRQELVRAGLARSAVFRWETTARKTLAAYRKALGLESARPQEVAQ